jgi:Zn finger protein HypA/HybF involved in hydrogenase expression
MKIKPIKLKCEKCGHEWIPRTDDVRMCPKCRTAFWDVKKDKKDDE